MTTLDSRVFSVVDVLNAMQSVGIVFSQNTLKSVASKLLDENHRRDHVKLASRHYTEHKTLDVSVGNYLDLTRPDDSPR